MKCPKCEGTGQIADTFRIPLWTDWWVKSNVSFVELGDAGDNDQVREIGKAFGKFIRARAHGCFHDGLRDELNQD